MRAKVRGGDIAALGLAVKGIIVGVHDRQS
jgi:hypothetical protein